MKNQIHGLVADGPHLNDLDRSCKLHNRLLPDHHPECGSRYIQQLQVEIIARGRVGTQSRVVPVAKVLHKACTNMFCARSTYQTGFQVLIINRALGLTSGGTPLASCVTCVDKAVARSLVRSFARCSRHQVYSFQFFPSSHKKNKSVSSPAESKTTASSVPTPC
jgi:hypothetical protein